MRQARPSAAHLLAALWLANPPQHTHSHARTHPHPHKPAQLVVNRAKRTVPYPLLGENTLVLSDVLCLAHDKRGRLCLTCRCARGGRAPCAYFTCLLYCGVKAPCIHLHALRKPGHGLALLGRLQQRQRGGAMEADGALKSQAPLAPPTRAP